LGFAKTVRRLVRDGVRLSVRKEVAPEEFGSRRSRLDDRPRRLYSADYEDADARRLAKRLQKYRDNIFAFPDRDGVTFENNRAEREIRPAVIMRKNSYANKSETGAQVQAVLMSIYRTLKLRCHSPTKAVAEALDESPARGEFPPLPAPTSDDATKG